MVKLKFNDESKHQKFIRLATNRTQKVLDALRILGNCSNTQNYEYSIEEINRIFNSITSTTKEMKEKFLSNSRKFKKFTLG